MQRLTTPVHDPLMQRLTKPVHDPNLSEGNTLKLLATLPITSV